MCTKQKMYLLNPQGVFYFCFFQKITMALSSDRKPFPKLCQSLNGGGALSTFLVQLRKKKRLSTVISGVPL